MWNCNSNARFYFDQLLVDERDYDQTLESYFLKRGALAEKIHMEVKLPSGVWPSDAACKKRVVGCKQVTSGLYNLGNSKINDVMI